MEGPSTLDTGGFTPMSIVPFPVDLFRFQMTLHLLPLVKTWLSSLTSYIYSGQSITYWISMVSLIRKVSLPSMLYRANYCRVSLLTRVKTKKLPRNLAKSFRLLFSPRRIAYRLPDSSMLLWEYSTNIKMLDSEILLLRV